MSPATSADTHPHPARGLYDRSARQLTIVVDAAPADVDDVTVEASPTRVRITVSRAERDEVWTVAPPTRGHDFTGEREARYNNGVLTVSIGTEPRWRH
ncbi:Hsp20/alpha crystallin family protein [Halosolutus amylolyticus]|uniref:Hsp20/alpha crystallin family protein n=1 Tax=Halosolutus amylolyticus TaxID=2932267 RepID=A0ABD5PQU7_9EURY|nr:Hsp20/alpha crystallin family protein [Halosolutus amylolyticus]